MFRIGSGIFGFFVGVWIFGIDRKFGIPVGVAFCICIGCSEIALGHVGISSFFFVGVGIFGVSFSISGFFVSISFFSGGVYIFRNARNFFSLVFVFLFCGLGLSC